MFLRYFCVVDEGSLWGDLSFAYFVVFQEAMFAMRVLPWGKGEISAPSRWAPYGHYFQTEVPANYVNVVCGPPKALQDCLTVGVKNIAIVKVIEDLPKLSHYDLVICPTVDDVAKVGAHAQHVEPEALTVDQLLRGPL
jgi:hypothetical protein